MNGKPRERSVTVQVRLLPPLAHRLDSVHAKARARTPYCTGFTRSNLIRQALAEYVGRVSPPAPVQPVAQPVRHRERPKQP